MLPVVVLLPGHGAVSGYLLCKLLSTSSLFCWADCFGFDVPLATVTEPVEFGLTRMIVSVSWLATVQPVRSGTVTPAFVPDDGTGADVGRAKGLGDVAASGLGRPPTPPPGSY